MNGADPNAILGRIVSVLAYTLLIAIVGLIAIGLAGGDPAVRMTLTHIIESLIGVFVGVAVARIAGRSGPES